MLWRVEAFIFGEQVAGISRRSDGLPIDYPFRHGFTIDSTDSDAR